MEKKLSRLVLWNEVLVSFVSMVDGAAWSLVFATLGKDIQLMLIASTLLGLLNPLVYKIKSIGKASIIATMLALALLIVGFFQDTLYLIIIVQLLFTMYFIVVRHFEDKVKNVIVERGGDLRKLGSDIGFLKVPFKIAGLYTGYVLMDYFQDSTLVIIVNVFVLLTYLYFLIQIRKEARVP